MTIFESFVAKYRANRKVLLFIVYVALFLDNMLLTTVVPIIPEVCRRRRRMAARFTRADDERFSVFTAHFAPKSDRRASAAPRSTRCGWRDRGADERSKAPRCGRVGRGRRRVGQHLGGADAIASTHEPSTVGEGGGDDWRRVDKRERAAESRQVVAARPNAAGDHDAGALRSLRICSRSQAASPRHAL